MAKSKAFILSADLGEPEGGAPGPTPNSTPVMTTDQSRTAFATLLASLISANDLKRLTVNEFDLLIAKLAGEVMSNPQIHDILTKRAREAFTQMRGDARAY